MRLNLSLAVLAGLHLVAAFVFQWLILAEIGPGPETDAYIAGQTLPGLIVAIISLSLTRVMVPILAAAEATVRAGYAAGLLAIVTGFFLGFSGVLIASAQFWVDWLFPGFDANGRELTVTLARIQLVGMIFAAIVGVYNALCHSRMQFYRVELAQLFTYVAALASLPWALTTFGIAGAAYVALGRFVGHAIVMAVLSGRTPSPSFPHELMQQVWSRAAPLIASSGVYKLAPVVDRFLTSMAAAGSMSVLTLAQNLNTAVIQLVDRAIVAPVIPALAVASERDQWTSFRRAYRTRMAMIILPVTLVLGIVFVFGPMLFDALFGHGRFAADRIDELWIYFLALGGVALGGTAGQLTASCFYAMGDTHTPTRIGLAAFTFGIALKVLGFQLHGVLGLAIATSMYYILSSVLMTFFLERRLNENRT